MHYRTSNEAAGQRPITTLANGFPEHFSNKLRTLQRVTFAQRDLVYEGLTLYSRDPDLIYQLKRYHNEEENKKGKRSKVEDKSNEQPPINDQLMDSEGENEVGQGEEFEADDIEGLVCIKSRHFKDYSVFYYKLDADQKRLEAQKKQVLKSLRVQEYIIVSPDVHFGQNPLVNLQTMEPVNVFDGEIFGQKEVSFGANKGQMAYKFKVKIYESQPITGNRIGEAGALGQVTNLLEIFRHSQPVVQSFPSQRGRGRGGRGRGRGRGRGGRGGQFSRQGGRNRGRGF